MLNDHGSGYRWARPQEASQGCIRWKNTIAGSVWVFLLEVSLMEEKRLCLPDE
jgi:hypothetical protein